MKKIILLCGLLIFVCDLIFSQNITSDTILANEYFSKADKHRKTLNFDSALLYLSKVNIIYKKYYDATSLENANYLSLKGWIYFNKTLFDSALFYWNEALEIKQKLLGEKHQDVASIYNFIGAALDDKSEYDKALESYHKALKVRLELFGENHTSVAGSYNNIGVVYMKKADFDKALVYYNKALKIKIELLGEKNFETASSYQNIGIVYKNKSEYNNALEYFNRALGIWVAIAGEKQIHVTTCYNNIGNVYKEKSEYNKAMEYHTKALNIRRELLGENHVLVASSYFNLGSIYLHQSEYNTAMEFFNRALEIYLKLLGENHTNITNCYNNIGLIYKSASEFDKALEYFNKALKIQMELFGEKHILIAMSYYNIGNIYKEKSEYHLALEYYNKATISCLTNAKDTSNVNFMPEIREYLNWDELLKYILEKTKCFILISETTPSDHRVDYLRFALLHLQAADTLIQQVRKTIKSEIDKLGLSEKAAAVYKGAVQLLLSNSELLTNNKNTNHLLFAFCNYRELAFYFSEQNKSQVLLQSLNENYAKQFAGIPDSLLEKEHTLRIAINLYQSKLADNLDSNKDTFFRNKLFDAKRSYEALVATLEKNYPDYYTLKFAGKPVSIDQIKHCLSKSSALINYMLCDNDLVAFVITKNGLQIYNTPLINDFEFKIREIRNCFTSKGKTKTNSILNLAFELYNQLFPFQLPDNIKNLIIIPDGSIGLIPFEALITEKFDLSLKENIDVFKELPYLIKKYNISYNYSASLFYQNHQKTEHERKEDLKYDLIALAPIFENTKFSGNTLFTSKVSKNITNHTIDSNYVRFVTQQGFSLSELPASKIEVQNIIRLSDKYRLKALAKTHLFANEQFVKSGELSKTRILHIATHGTVNEDKPDLSGIYLANYFADNQDGFLQTGEIYNIKLNADLTVLSACETGLGMQATGEGIIGLTRALMYAGSRNICVSLWQVSDSSTSELMINFYKNFLDPKKSFRLKKTGKFGKSLRDAKLKMISDGIYAHPFFWSPFILVGE